MLSDYNRDTDVSSLSEHENDGESHAGFLHENASQVQYIII